MAEKPVIEETVVNFQTRCANLGQSLLDTLHQKDEAMSVVFTATLFVLTTLVAARCGEDFAAGIAPDIAALVNKINSKLAEPVGGIN